MAFHSHRSISKFNGIRPLAKALGKSPSTVDRWRTSGEIRNKYEVLILKAAKKNNIVIEPEDYVQPKAVFAQPAEG